jgi:hypothetical protein
MNLSSYKKVLQHSVKRISVLAALLAAAALAGHAQVVFSPVINVSNDIGSSREPQVAVDLAGNINIVWSDQTGACGSASCAVGIFFSRSTDGGVTERGNIMFAHSSDRGANFSAPVSLGTGAAVSPSVVVDSAGSLNVLWEAAVSGHNPFDVFYTRSADGGASFSTPVDVTTIPDGADYEQVAVGPDGSVDAMWSSDCQNTYFSTCPAGPSSEVFFSQSKDGVATFSAPANLSSTPTGTSVGNARMVVTSSGNVDIVWSADNAGQIRPF